MFNYLSTVPDLLGLPDPMGGRAHYITTASYPQTGTLSALKI